MILPTNFVLNNHYEFSMSMMLMMLRLGFSFNVGYKQAMLMLMTHIDYKRNLTYAVLLDVYKIQK